MLATLTRHLQTDTRGELEANIEAFRKSGWSIGKIQHYEQGHIPASGKPWNVQVTKTSSRTLRQELHAVPTNISGLPRRTPSKVVQARERETIKRGLKNLKTGRIRRFRGLTKEQAFKTTQQTQRATTKATPATAKTFKTKHGAVITTTSPRLQKSLQLQGAHQLNIPKTATTSSRSLATPQTQRATTKATPATAKTYLKVPREPRAYPRMKKSVPFGTVMTTPETTPLTLVTTRKQPNFPHYTYNPETKRLKLDVGRGRNHLLDAAEYVQITERMGKAPFAPVRPLQQLMEAGAEPEKPLSEVSQKELPNEAIDRLLFRPAFSLAAAPIVGGALLLKKHLAVSKKIREEKRPLIDMSVITGGKKQRTAGDVYVKEVGGPVAKSVVRSFTGLPALIQRRPLYGIGTTALMLAPVVGDAAIPKFRLARAVGGEYADIIGSIGGKKAVFRDVRRIGTRKTIGYLREKRFLRNKYANAAVETPAPKPEMFVSRSALKTKLEGEKITGSAKIRIRQPGVEFLKGQRTLKKAGREFKRPETRYRIPPKNVADVNVVFKLRKKGKIYKGKMIGTRTGTDEVIFTKNIRLLQKGGKLTKKYISTQLGKEISDKAIGQLTLKRVPVIQHRTTGSVSVGRRMARFPEPAADVSFLNIKRTPRTGGEMRLAAQVGRTQFRLRRGGMEFRVSETAGLVQGLTERQQMLLRMRRGGLQKTLGGGTVDEIIAKMRKSGRMRRSLPPKAAPPAEPRSAIAVIESGEQHARIAPRRGAKVVIEHDDVLEKIVGEATRETAARELRPRYSKGVSERIAPRSIRGGRLRPPAIKVTSANVLAGRRTQNIKKRLKSRQHIDVKNDMDVFRGGKTDLASMIDDIIKTETTSVLLQRQRQDQKQQQRQRTHQRQRYGFPGIAPPAGFSQPSPPPPPPMPKNIIPKTPPFPFIPFMPQMKYGTRHDTERRPHKKIRTRYKPSLIAVIGGITAKEVPRRVTGLGIRPIVVRRR